MAEKKKGAPVKIEWGLIDESWKAGIKSLQTIANEYEKQAGRKITPAGIKKHYDDLGIPRDLTGKIKAKAEALVNKELVNALVNKKLSLTESDIVNANAEQQSTIILHERKDVSKARTIAMGLLAELESQVTDKELYEQLGELLNKPDEKGNADKMNDIYRRVISFGGRTDSMKKLGETLKTLIDLERRVYRIDDVQSEGGIEDFLRKMRGV